MGLFPGPPSPAPWASPPNSSPFFIYHPLEKFAHLASSGYWPAARLLDAPDLLIVKT
jgi:hypothetical protein